MKGAYPDLVQNREFILKMLGGEEQQFGRVLEQGLRIIEEALSTKNENNSSGVLPGNLAFVLYDTYGFPVEETIEIARDRGISVDMEGFEREMKTQRERARAGSAAKFSGGGGEAKIFKYRDLNAGPIMFVGYERLTAQTTIAALVTPDGDAINHAEQGQEVEVVLRETPFYAEGGGQAGDTGTILSLKGHFDIEDTQTPLEGLIVHKGQVRSGVMMVGDEVNAKVDRERRLDIARNHSSTHLLHEALRRVLGTHVRQAGSSVSPERLRFDFTHIQAMTPDEIHEVERMVNEQVRRNLPSVKNELAYTEALDSGYLAFFGDKYGETVRVVDMGLNDPEEANARPFSREVCGGTHLDSLGETGLFLITSEGSIGSGIRRVEAVTGRAAATMARNNIAALDNLALSLETTPGEIASRIETLQNQLDTERRRAASLERQNALAQAGEMLTKVQQANGINILATNVTVASADMLREMGDHLRGKIGSGVVVLGAVVDNRPSLVAMITPDLVDKGIDAVTLIKGVAAIIGGSGGGRPTLAQAGGTKAEKMDDALAAVLGLVIEMAKD